MTAATDSAMSRQSGWLRIPPSRGTSGVPWRRVPFVQQLGSDDCGASCLAMVLGAHGIHDVAAECRELCGAGRDGTRLRTLATVARGYGLAATAMYVRPPALASVALPAIAHWQSRHFVVVERWSARRITVVDPARGRQVMTHAEFADGYTGVLLMFEPHASLVSRARARVPLWVHYLAAMFQERAAQGALAQIVIASLVLQATGLAAPVFTKLVVDDVAPPGSALSLGVIAVCMAVVVLSKTVTTFVRSAVMIRLQSRLDARLTEGFFDHLLRLPYRFFQGRSSGDLLLRLSSNTMIREILTTQLLSLMLDGPLALLYLAVLAAVAPSFALLVAGLAVVQAALVLASLRPLRDLGHRTLAAKSDEQGCLVELMKGIAYVKASGAEQRAYDRWVELFRRQLGVYVERSYFAAKFEIALGLVRSASPLALLWYGAALVLDGALPLGTMLALTALAASFLTPFMSLVQNSQQLQMLEAYVERLTDVLQTEPEARPAAPALHVEPRRLIGAVEVRGLSYRFSPDSRTVVDDVSFSVRAGEKLGIVGPTGSGKSTILMLLLGLYRPTAGEVFFDGTPLSELDPRVIRQRCGVVQQDVALFGGSVHANIALSAAAASREQVAAAARVAGLDHDVASFPMGYDTRLAESGANLSGGQRQRLAIARALVGEPAILLLDEASSHLDVAAERALNANLEQLRCTRIVVAHRLTAVRNADQILVMNGGRVVERGTHDELMRLDRVYAGLAAEQGPAVNARPTGRTHLVLDGQMNSRGHRGRNPTI
jgi:ABC-type bacteriocin/lantibiotic exporter with double-glycine peptidase domain